MNGQPITAWLLGFMNSVLLKPGGGNYGVLNVLAALHCVGGNIVRFGGGLQRVTPGGESAGILCPLLSMPQAQGLFRAAVISSDDCLHDVDTVGAARERAAQLGARMGCIDATLPAPVPGGAPRQGRRQAWRTLTELPGRRP